MDSETMKLGLLLETAQTHQQLIDALIDKLNAHTSNLSGIVRAEVRRAITEELATLQGEVEHSVAVLERLKRAAQVRSALWVVGTSFASLVLALAVAWWLLPSRSEIVALRGERDELQGRVDLLVSRGARADLRTCGAGQHLCVRVNARLGGYGPDRDYFVIHGY